MPIISEKYSSILPYLPGFLDHSELITLHRDLEQEFENLSNVSDAFYEIIGALDARIKILEEKI